MNHILDARTILQRIEVVMTYYYRAGIALVQFFKQSSHGYLLSLSAGIVGLTSDIEPSLVADAYRRTRTYYHQDGSAVSIIGSENVQELISYDMPEKWLQFPMHMGDSVCGYFNGTC